jgi:Holliday junction resolvasome RuvABC endonuclease subunit
MISGNKEAFKVIQQSTTPIYLGIDCSSRAIHGVWIDEEERIIAMLKWRSADLEFDTRFIEISLQFSKDLSKIQVIPSAAVEAAIFIQNPKSTMEIASVVGGVRLACASNHIECVSVDNRHWKKHVLGKGNCNKKDIKDFAVDKWGELFIEQDWADAACIALWRKRRAE